MATVDIEPEDKTKVIYQEDNREQAIIVSSSEEWIYIQQQDDIIAIHKDTIQEFIKQIKQINK